MDNNYKNMLRVFILGLLIPLLASFSVSANQGSGANVPSASDISTYVDKNIDGIVNYPIRTEGEDIEYVHLWFKQILGGFIFSPWSQMGKDPGGAYNGDDITLLSKALGFTNILSIIICLIVTYYMIIGGALNTAADGQVLGKNWNTPWLMLRTAVGFTLITPMTIIGGMTLSLAQVGVIWLLIIGSNAASILWYYAVDELSNGAQIVSPNMDLGRHKVSDMMQMIMCADASVRVRSASAYSVSYQTKAYGRGRDKVIKDKTTGKAYTGSEMSSILGEVMAIHYVGKGPQVILGKDVTGESSHFKVFGEPDVQPNGSDRIRKITFGLDGSCGEIAFDTGDVGNIAEDVSSQANIFSPTMGIGDTVKSLDYRSRAMQAGRQEYAMAVIEIINHLIQANKELQKDKDFSTTIINFKFDTDLSDASPEPSVIGYQELANFVSSEKVKQCLVNAGDGCGDDVIANHLYSKLMAAKEHFNKAAKIYADELVQRVHDATTQGDKTKPLMEQFYANMKTGGWPAAGLWFFEISALPGMSYNVIDTVHKSIKVEPISFCFQSTKLAENNCYDMEAEANSGKVISSILLKESLRTDGAGSAGVGTEIDLTHAPCGVLGNCTAASSTSDRLSVAITREVLEFLSDSPLNANPLTDGSTDANNRLSSPFLFASQLGHTMNFIAQNTVAASILAISTRDYLEGFDSEKNDTLIDDVKQMTGWEKATHLVFGLPKAIALNTLSFGGGLLLMAAITAFSSGFLLAYVIPFMPVMTWIMMMAGYMLTAVESVAAAPLAIVLLFTPEGQGISGSRFERALQLVVMAVLRPSFMVLGMLAGLTVSFVAFTMMNVFFFTAAEYLLSGTIFDLFAVIILYVSATYQLCKLMVETMYSLPDRIGEWFAGGVSRQFGESRIQDNAEGSMQMLSSKMQALPQEIVKLQQKNTMATVDDGSGAKGRG